MLLCRYCVPADPSGPSLVTFLPECVEDTTREAPYNYQCRCAAL